MTHDNMWIVIPAYQEAAVIYDVVRKTFQAGFKNILVIDDGSADATSDEARRAGAHVVRHTVNRGKGAALHTGLEAAQLKGAQIVVTMDGDGQHDPQDIEKLVAPIMLQQADVVLGTRMTRPAGMDPLRWFAARFGNIVTWLLSGLWVRDSQSGFRAFSRLAAGYLKTQSNTYDYETEVIQLIARHSLRYVEVPIHVLYTAHSVNKPYRQNIVNGLKTVSRLVWRVVS